MKTKNTTRTRKNLISEEMNDEMGKEKLQLPHDDYEKIVIYNIISSLIRFLFTRNDCC